MGIGGRTRSGIETQTDRDRVTNGQTVGDTDGRGPKQGHRLIRTVTQTDRDKNGQGQKLIGTQTDRDTDREGQ
jgi:hypothetical protein